MEYNLLKLRELFTRYCTETILSINDEFAVKDFLYWLSYRESKRQKGDVSRSFGSKGQETE